MSLTFLNRRSIDWNRHRISISVSVPAACLTCGLLDHRLTFRDLHALLCRVVGMEILHYFVLDLLGRYVNDALTFFLAHF
jgi:hypothetical protein